MAAEHEAQPEPVSTYSVGDELRMYRESMGKSIADIVDAVRIQSRYLEALEDGRLEDLPGTVYALGFVRTYADYLGLNGAEFVARYKEETQGLATQNYVMPEPLEEGKVPTAAILFVAVVLAAAAYGGWYFLSQPEERVAQQVPDVPERLAVVTEEPAPAGQGATPTVPPPSAAPAAPTLPLASEGDIPPPAAPEQQRGVTPSPPQEQHAAAPTPAPVESVSVPASAPTEVAAATDTAPSQPSDAGSEAAPPPAVAPPPEPEAPAAEQSAAPAAEQPGAPAEPEATESVVAEAPPAPPVEEEVHEPQVFGQGNIDARIVILAEDDAWIEVTDSDDARLFSRVLRKGDKYLAPNREGAKFVTGNAGGLKILVDGEPVPSLGPPGQVRRDVKLDADLLKAGEAWP